MISYKKIFKIFVWLLFLSFLVLYFAQKGGYYEEINSEKTYLTEEKIKEFEENVKNGKQINVDDYIVEDKKNYENKISKFGLFTSKAFAKTFKWVMNNIFGGIDKIVNE